MDFPIRLSSFRQIQTFVSLAARHPFEIRVGNDHQNIDGKDLMGMSSLDYTRPVIVHTDGPADTCLEFQRNVLALQK